MIIVIILKIVVYILQNSYSLFNGDGDDVTLMGESYESTFEIRSENFELPALLHIGGSYDFLFNDIYI